MNKLMKMLGGASLVVALALSAVFVAAPAGVAVAADAAESKYLVVSPHTADQCLKVLDEVKAQGGDQALAKYDWGCMAGNHTGYMMVSAKSEADALNMVPASVRPQAKAMKLNKFTSAQIEEFHKKK